MNKFRSTDRSQLMLLPPRVEDFVSETHISRLIDKIVNELDTSNIEKKYSYFGRKGYHPKDLLKILFYGYSIGDRSSRKLADRCKSDVAYMFLSSMQKPDFRTISDFRKNNLEQLKEYFKEIVTLCFNLKMFSGGGIFIDGTKIRGNASAKRTKDMEELNKALKGAEEKIRNAMEEAEKIDKEEDSIYGEEQGNELPKDLRDDKVMLERIKEAMKELQQTDAKKINLTDSDAVYMKERNGVIKPAFNCQLAVADSQVIVAMDVVKEPNDTGQLKPMINNVREAVPEFKFDKVVADSGYGVINNIKYLSEENIDGYVVPMNPELKKVREDKTGQYRFHRYNFVYDAERDAYCCPKNQELKFKKFRKFRGHDIRVYRCSACNDCKDKKICTNAHYRELAINQEEKLIINMQEKLASERGKKEYEKRMYSVEPVFGDMKHNRGYRQFLLRSLKKVQGEFALMCTVHNIRKIYQYLSFESGKLKEFLETIGKYCLKNENFALLKCAI